jgi:hypothetical protein
VLQVALDRPNGPVLSAFPVRIDHTANRPESPWSNSRHRLMLERNRRTGTDGGDVSKGIDVQLVIPAVLSPEHPAAPDAPAVTVSTPAGPTPPSYTALPRTGGDLATLLLVAAVLVALGVVLVQLGRGTRACSRRSS